MKIYFTAATSTNGELIPVYRQIIDSIKNHGGTIMSGEQIVNQDLLNKDRQLSSKEIFIREKELIDQADCVIAETSKPSLGVGGEIVFALTANKPVLALIDNKYEDKISPMLIGNPSENLFIEYYSQNNYHHKVRDFIKHLSSLKNRSGKLIVIDGADGSGKTTQARLLIDYLKNKNVPVRYYDFPQYYHSFHGKTVAKFMRGEFGGINQVSPYLASLAYALDRASVKEEMQEFLSRGGIIIANRYATSNMAHQSAKFSDKVEREKYLKWEYDLEYKIHKIPKENLVIYLHVPWQISAALTDKKETREYLKGKTKDIAEIDLNHQALSELMYLELANRYRHWIKINCVENNQIMTPESIHKKVIQAVLPFLGSQK